MSDNDKDLKIGVQVAGTEQARADLESVAKAERDVAGASGALENSTSKAIVATEDAANHAISAGEAAAKKSIFAVEDAARQAARELDVLKVKADQSGGLAGTDLTSGLGNKAENLVGKLGYAKEMEVAKALGKSLGVEITGAAAADAVAIAGSFAAIGASAVVAVKGVSDSLKDYKDLMARWREATGKELTESDHDILKWAQVFENVEQPIDKALDKIGGFLTSVADIAKHPLESLKDLRKYIDGSADLDAAIQRAADAKKKLDETRQTGAERNQTELVAIYGEEAAKLKEQEDTMKRIFQLRSTLGNLEIQGAQQEVASAKQRGGDVALAEANLLATELRTGLDKLEGELSTAKQKAVAAQRNSDAALVEYEAAIRDGLDPSDVKALGDKVTKAQTAANDANQALQDQSKVFTATKTNLLRGTELELNDLEKEYDGKTSAQAKKAFDGVYESLKTAVAEGPQDAIARIKIDVSSVTTAANNKAGEVKEGLAAINTAVNENGRQLATQSNAAATNLGAVMSDLKTGVSSMNQNSAALIAIVRDLASTQQQQQSQIGSLKQQVQTASQRR